MERFIFTSMASIKVRRITAFDEETEVRSRTLKLQPQYGGYEWVRDVASNHKAVHLVVEISFRYLHRSRITFWPPASYCVSPCFGAKTALTHQGPGHLLLLLRGPVLMLTCSLSVLSVVGRGQHGHLDMSAAMRPPTQQTVMHVQSDSSLSEPKLNF